MSYTMEDYKRDSSRRLFQEMTPQEVLANLSPKHRRELLKGLLAEEHLEGLSLEERLKGLTEEEAAEYFSRQAKGRTARQRK